MEIIAEFSFKSGRQFISKHHSTELQEAKDVVSSLDATKLKTKISKEKTMKGKKLYSPIALNRDFKKLFERKGWESKRIQVETFVPEIGKPHRGFREMDMIKNKLGIEIQFGKYAFMVYNVAAKMTIFAKQGLIDSGIEIVPMLSLANEMSSGVSYFEQMKTDLEYRGASNIDIPVLILGIDVVKRPCQETLA